MFLKACSTDNGLGSNYVYDEVYTFVCVMNHLFMIFNRNQMLPHYRLVQKLCLAMNFGKVNFFPIRLGWVLKIKSEII